jgi:glycosyltransferase involved in cell wall biosynthesis
MDVVRSMDPEADFPGDRPPAVSVLIPVFNSQSTLRAAIESAMRQSLRHIEILVVDDGSADGSFAIAREISVTDRRVRAISLGRNHGKPKAMNHALDLVRGDWVAVLDADDTFEPRRLEYLVALGDAHKTDMVADNQNHVDGATGRFVATAFSGSRLRNPIDRPAFVHLASHPHDEFDLGILKTVTRTAFIRKHRLRYNELAGLGEDFYYLMEFFVRGGTLWVSHDALYNWTLPFSPSTRRWTATGHGAWRYDFRRTFPAHNQYVASMTASGQADMLGMLRRRGRRMLQMMHYTDAQKATAEKRHLAALRILVLHPSTYPVLVRRIIRRYLRRRGGKKL